MILLFTVNAFPFAAFMLFMVDILVITASRSTVARRGDRLAALRLHDPGRLAAVLLTRY